MKKNKKKYKYSIWQNIRFMLRVAWKSFKSLIWDCLLLVCINVSLKVVQMLTGPQILAKVEKYSPMNELFIIVFFFAGMHFILKALSLYLTNVRFPKKMAVRCRILGLINHKFYKTSYPNSKNPKVHKLREDAFQSTASNSNAAENIWVTLTELLTNIGGFIVYLCVLSKFEPILLLVVVITAVISFFVNKYSMDWINREGRKEEQAGYHTEINYIGERSENIALAKDVRIFGLSNWLMELYERSLTMYRRFLYCRERACMWGCTLDVILTFFKNGIAYGYLIYVTLAKGMLASEFLLYFSALSGFTAWVTGILTQSFQLNKECMEISRIQEYLAVEECFLLEGGTPIPNANGYELKLENVCFGYPGTEEKIFQNLDITIHPGEKVAVVGLNGAGKTTLVKLLCGFYDPDEGRVLLNGEDIRNFNRQEYYELFSAVFQEYFLQDVTIAEQVAQQVKEINFEKVAECLEKAGLTEQVARFPMGVNTHMGREVYPEGVVLSGGQTQRLLLARALYKDGLILVLDEPTAALDPIAENDIYMKYNEMTEKKTSLFISHRLASTRFCDRILMMENGTIAEEGTHEELLALKGSYAELFQVQSRYYQEGKGRHEAEGRG